MVGEPPVRKPGVHQKRGPARWLAYSLPYGVWGASGPYEACCLSPAEVRPRHFCREMGNKYIRVMAPENGYTAREGRSRARDLFLATDQSPAVVPGAELTVQRGIITGRLV